MTRGPKTPQEEELMKLSNAEANITLLSMDGWKEGDSFRRNSDGTVTLITETGGEHTYDPADITRCSECGMAPMGEACYNICPNSNSYYSPEQERADDAHYGEADRWEGYGDPEPPHEPTDGPGWPD